MADEATKQEETVTEAAPAQEESGTDWKAESRKWEDRAKANTARIKDLESKLTELDGSKSDLEKALERIGALEKQNADLERARLTAEVAGEHHIDPSLLAGSTREELEAYAQKLLAWRGEVKKAAAPGLGRQPETTPNDNATRRLVRELLHKE